MTSCPNLAQTAILAPMASLHIRARKSGPKWRGYWTDSTGQPHNRTIGTAWVEPGPNGWRPKRGRPPEGALSEQAARAELERLIASRENEIEAAAASTTNPPFKQVSVEYLEWARKAGRTTPATHQDYRLMLADRSRITERFGHVPIRDIEAADINQFLNELDDTDLSPRTINKHRQVIGNVYRYANLPETYGLNYDPVPETEKRREPSAGDIDPFDLEEIEAIIATARSGTWRQRRTYELTPVTQAVEQWENDRDATLYQFAVETGFRQGEIRALRWQDIQFDAQKVRAEVGLSANEKSTTKGKKFRYVPIGRTLVDVLRAHKDRAPHTGRDDLVFANFDGTPLDRSAIRRRFMAVLKEAGLRHRRFHDLRHTFGSQAIQVFTLREVQEMMGHKSIKTTERYLHAKASTEDSARIERAFRPQKPAEGI